MASSRAIFFSTWANRRAFKRKPRPPRTCLILTRSLFGLLKAFAMMLSPFFSDQQGERKLPARRTNVKRSMSTFKPDQKKSNHERPGPEGRRHRRKPTRRFG